MDNKTFRKISIFPKEAGCLLAHSIFYFINTCGLTLFIKGGTNERF